MVHGTSLSVSLAEFFTDDDGDALTLTATYSLSGGSAVSIPGGIFSQLSTFELYVDSTSILDIGTYTISILVSDAEPKSLTSSFTIEILNTAPKVI
jgi:hypothetical protein